MTAKIEFSLSYSGAKAEGGSIDFYDVADALVGFQRYLALTTHFVINSEIITQAPSLKNARILALPPEEGSWKIKAAVIAAGTITTIGGGVFAVGTADKDTPIGNLGRSIYDYVVSETIGVHPDYETTIGKQYKEERRRNPNFPDLSQSKLDSLVEKCQVAITRMHRPIVASKTARKAKIKINDGSGDAFITGSLSEESYDYINFTKRDQREVVVLGRITSYNAHTFKGRIYLPLEKRPVSFILADYAQTDQNIGRITASLSSTAKDKFSDRTDVKCFVFRFASRHDRLKSLIITRVVDP